MHPHIPGSICRQKYAICLQIVHFPNHAFYSQAQAAIYIEYTTIDRFGKFGNSTDNKEKLPGTRRGKLKPSNRASVRGYMRFQYSLTYHEAMEPSTAYRTHLALLPRASICTNGPRTPGRSLYKPSPPTNGSYHGCGYNSSMIS